MTQTLSVKLVGSKDSEYQVIPNVRDFEILPSGVLTAVADNGDFLFFSAGHWVGAALVND